MSIDQERLLQLAKDPNNNTDNIAKALGLTTAQLYYELGKDQQLKESYAAARREAQGNGNGARGSRSTQRRAPVKGRAKTPPRNGNAKGGITRELLRKIILEFNHFDVYGRPSEHFDDVRAEMGALL